MTAADFRRLQSWVEAGGDLVVAGLPDVPAWAGASLEPDRIVDSDIAPTSSYEYEFGQILLAVPPGPSLALTDAERMLGRGTGAYASFKKLGEGRVIVLADDKLFTNIALAARDNAAFLISLFRPLHREVELGNVSLVVGEIVRAHIADGMLTDGRVDPEKLKPVGRLSGDAYAFMGRLVHIPRPKVEERG